MFKEIFQFAATGIIIISVPQLVQAQIITNPIYNPWINPTGNLGIQNSIDLRNMEENKRKTPKNNSSTSVKPSAKLAYKPSIAIRRANLKKFIENARQTDPTSAAEIEQLFASKDVIARISEDMAALGLKPNNVGDAFTIYLTNAWFAARGRDNNLSRSQMNVVRNQLTEMLLKSPQINTATDAQKQVMAETFLIQSLLMAISIEGAKSDPALLAQVQKVIAQGAKGLGLDLYQLSLTSQGFQGANK
jgi:hypothetical protein